jgi:hypothetical protein
MNAKKPAFTEANDMVLQHFTIIGKWEDYASIKTVSDLETACGNVERHPQAWRIVRKSGGTKVVYPN